MNTNIFSICAVGPSRVFTHQRCLHPSNIVPYSCTVQDGDSSKTSESSSTEEKSSESSSAPDSSLHLVALDVRWFVSLHHTLLGARDAVVVAGDMIEKNMEKLLRPKGTNTQGGSMYSF